MAYAVTASHLLDNIVLQDLDATSATALHELGYTVHGQDGKDYMYTQYDCSAVAVTAGGQPASWTNSTNLVTSDTSDGDAEGGAGAGVFTVAQANSDDTFIWIQTKGEVEAALVSTAVAAGDSLYVSQNDEFESVEDVFNSNSATTVHIVAVARTAPSGSGASTANIVLL